MSAVPGEIGGGQRVGRYELIRRLAVGGMAEIYLGRVPGVGIEGFEKLVVLKRILPQHALDPELLRMFLDEARLTATLTHPHVTELYDVGTSGDAPFFTMEYVHGANLRQLMKRAQGAGGGSGPVPLEHAIGIVAAAASGLHYAHEKLGPGGEPLHIVHRDVSPSNVLVSYDGAVKVSDFGIAKWAFQRTQTQEGALKGKFAYMSPEQCKGQALDRRSDVFALGTILYELTVGEGPFKADTDFEILNQIVAGTPKPPAWDGDKGAEGGGGGRAYPARLGEIVMRALARAPGDRYPTAQALQVELEAFARDERLEVSTVALGRYMQDLFASELAAWHEAERAGKSLGEHLAGDGGGGAGGAGRAARDEVRTATDAFAATRPAVRRKRRMAAAMVAAAGLAAAVAGAVVVARSGSESASARHTGAAPTATATTSTTATTTTTTTTTTTRPVGGAAEIAVAKAASTGGKPEHNVESHPEPAPPPKSASRRGAKARASAPPVAAPPAADKSIESKLGKWDPDSPVPP